MSGHIWGYVPLVEEDEGSQDWGTRRRLVWRGISALLAVATVALLFQDSALARGAGIWCIGFSIFAWNRGRPPRELPEVTPQGLAGEWRFLTLLAALVTAVCFAGALLGPVAGRGTAFGFGVFFLWVTLMVSWVWWQRRKDAAQDAGDQRTPAAPE